MPASNAMRGVKYMHIRNQILHVKYKSWLIVKLKAIKSRKNIFGYLSL